MFDRLSSSHQKNAIFFSTIKTPASGELFKGDKQNAETGLRLDHPEYKYCPHFSRLAVRRMLSSIPHRYVENIDIELALDVAAL